MRARVYHLSSADLVLTCQFTQTTNQSQFDIFHNSQSKVFFSHNWIFIITLYSKQEYKLGKIPWLESKSLSVSFFLTLQTAFQLSQEHIASSRNLPHTNKSVSTRKQMVSLNYKTQNGPLTYLLVKSSLKSGSGQPFYNTSSTCQDLARQRGTYSYSGIVVPQ